MFKHATVSAWQREHEGSYKAEIDGWTLEVKWHPEGPGKRRGFSWTAERAGEDAGAAKLSGAQDEPIEEMENAMVAAEEAAKHHHRLHMPAAPESSGDAAPAD